MNSLHDETRITWLLEAALVTPKELRQYVEDTQTVATVDFYDLQEALEGVEGSIRSLETGCISDMESLLDDLVSNFKTLKVLFSLVENSSNEEEEVSDTNKAPLRAA